MQTRSEIVVSYRPPEPDPVIILSGDTSMDTDGHRQNICHLPTAIRHRFSTDKPAAHSACAF